MNRLITFILGACTGAFLLWFGFGQEVLVLKNDRLVRVDRFTGRASYVFVSALEVARGEQAEVAQMEALEEAAAKAHAAEEEKKKGEAVPVVNEKAAKMAKPGWRELTAEEIGKLEFKWGAPRHNSSQIELRFHNPFEQMVEIERVRVLIPAHDGAGGD